MKKMLKRVGLVLLILLALLVMFVGYINININNRLEKTYHFQPAELNIPTDSISLQAGRHLVDIKGCGDCHGKNLAGTPFINDPALGSIPAPNLTRGKGGLPADFSDRDWVMALQHGVGKDGKTLLVMPSHESSVLSDEDMANIIAYCKSVPPVDSELPAPVLKPMSKVLAFMGQLPLLSAELVDHELPRVAAITPAETAVYGKYLSVSCIGCHAANLKGGKHPVPNFPAVPDITSASRTGKLSADEFMHVLRTGITPDGRQMKAEHMPWPMTKEYSDLEIRALYLYLKSI